MGSTVGEGIEEGGVDTGDAGGEEDVSLIVSWELSSICSVLQSRLVEGNQ